MVYTVRQRVGARIYVMTVEADDVTTEPTGEGMMTATFRGPLQTDAGVFWRPLVAVVAGAVSVAEKDSLTMVTGNPHRDEPGRAER